MADLAGQLARDGFVVFDADTRVARWARRAHVVAIEVAQDSALQEQWLRHGKTWFVGVDALPNGSDGAVEGVPLVGSWEGLIPDPGHWHRAQLSVVYPGYPVKDADESDAAHNYRIKSGAAHVDGLHLEAGRRILREAHSFILGLPLNGSDACPLVVWAGSHIPMQAAFATALGDADPIGADLTDPYKDTRARCFETCKRVEIDMGVGQAVLLHRHLLHGVVPWADGMTCPLEGRMVAYFRPECADARDWVLG